MSLSPPPSPAPQDRLRGRLMAEALGRLLDRVRGSREVLPHLAALERGLLAEGLPALAAASTPALGRIASQLASLPLPEDDRPLQDLLHRVMDSLEARRAEVSNQPFDIEKTVVIEEMSHTDFMTIQRAEAPTEFDDGRSLDGRPAQPR
ncbi:hypothetical protein [Rubrivivax rivuli]|uniref:Uncharacterized protein n=1 Tax=Rubrivivax rivuli TaxID=1862385 RepID=A0A437RKQ1_9BURK|nr:hypothetical protein [Rubrivivax rivuli]RVU47373.1 hypothetical protein EOE66_06400 [Rubrivivax rivuli]